uniref:Choline transporter-like protein n=1 Tax=Clastoptera arizonana TaxID=38151 RepID=A0A1B6CV87_9HEMI
MGGCLSSEDQVQPLDYSGFESPSSNPKHEFSGPVKSKSRSCTDVLFLILMAVFFIVLVGIVGYCIKNGDIRRITNGYDNCGNICGIKNEQLSNKELACHGVDMTDKKFLLVKGVTKSLLDKKHSPRECVHNCSDYPDYAKFLNRCVPNETTKAGNRLKEIQSFFFEVSQDLHLCWPEIVYLCLIAFGLSVLMLYLLRYASGILVWIVLGGVIVTCITGTIYLWLKWHEKSMISGNEGEIAERKKSSYFVFAIIATIVTVIILLIILVMRKRIQLVVQLFEEAGKAVNAIPSLLFLPVVTFLVLTVVVVMWFVFEFLIESSGFLQRVPDNDYLYYKKDTIMKIARWYNLLAAFWFIQFCIGCQHMVIAGAVATWFFTRDKTRLASPITKSFSNMVQFHLGSVAFGSLLIALIQFARVCLKAIKSQVKGSESNEIQRCLFRSCQFCLYCLEKCLSYLSRNAYIEIAIYGKNFCESGKQAFKLLTSNALRVAAINSVGDFMLFLSKILVVAITVLIGSKVLEHKQGLQHMWVPLLLVGFFAYLVVHCFMTVYEMVIDTIFICFCEDYKMNDGISKPYFMSAGLMEFVNNSKKVLAVGDGTNTESGA